jgi:thiol-disulfide isomerase/thioredoxin
MMELGSPAPDFDLPDMADPGGGRRSLASFAGSPALLVAFICNHCPFVLHILDGLVTFAADYRPKGLRTVAISANDVDTHPNDAPDRMTEMARGRGFQFPYLYDASQRTALDYGAICTPDFFLFDGGRRLFYRGQFDGSRPHTEWDADKPRNIVPVTGADLRAAADALLAGAAPPANQRPSAGCSIKWKPDNEPEWA